MAGDLVKGDDGLRRCSWGAAPPDYRGVPRRRVGPPGRSTTSASTRSSRLEGFQSGLSWLTILRKREGFRRAFAGFDPARVARFGARDVQRLLGDAAIVRHRGKIEATIANAAGHPRRAGRARRRSRRCVWSFEPARSPARAARVRAISCRRRPSRRRWRRTLKRYGFRFVGPTTAYAAMQSLGLVNDHLVGLRVPRAVCTAARAAFTPP